MSRTWRRCSPALPLVSLGGCGLASGSPSLVAALVLGCGLHTSLWPGGCSSSEPFGIWGPGGSSSLPLALHCLLGPLYLIIPFSVLSSVVVTHKILRKARGNLEVKPLRVSLTGSRLGRGMGGAGQGGRQGPVLPGLVAPRCSPVIMRRVRGSGSQTRVQFSLMRNTVYNAWQVVGI